MIIESIHGDEYEVSNEIEVCGDCFVCKNICEFGLAHMGEVDYHNQKNIVRE